ncbi:MAG TPA: hypothetical protein VFR50_16625 [Casimicrobiaceae bacterium]|nr:hypothetical protein [Casimicrobiaceae bacterium]
MRKFVALLILLVLPLQLAFAAGAEYCEIEKGDTGGHFGHHVHLCKTNADSPSKGSDGDSGCGFCKLGCTHAQASTLAFAVEAVPFAADEQLEPPLPPSHSPPGIDRPPRHALA